MSLNRLVLWLMILCYGLPGVLSAQVSTPDLIVFNIPLLSLNPVGVGARAVGFSFAFIGIADDATAASHNPGGFVQLERPKFSVVWSDTLQILHSDTASLANQNLNEVTDGSLIFPLVILNFSSFSRRIMSHPAFGEYICSRCVEWRANRLCLLDGVSCMGKRCGDAGNMYVDALLA